METIIIDEKTVSVNGVKYLRKEEPKPKFKVGQWVIGVNRTPYNPSRITSVDMDEVKYLYWNGEEETGSFQSMDVIRLATPTEIEAHLIKVAKEKGYKVGQKLWSFYEDLKPYCKDSFHEIEGDFHYNPKEDSLQADAGLRLYCKGTWATIIPPKKKLPTDKEGIGALIKLYHDQNDGLPFKTLIDEFLNDYED